MPGLFNIGGLEILILLGLFGLVAIGAVVLVIVLVIRSHRQPPPQTQPFTVGPPPRDLEQELRMLAKLRDEGVIQEEDFNLKKKALLGI